MPAPRKVILYIAMSLDGFIARPGDDLSFLSLVEKAGEDYGYGDFIESVDTVIMGRRTYDWVMRHVPDFSHADMEAFIITRTPRPANGTVQFYSGDLKLLIEELKKKEGKNIFADGGAEIVQALLKEGLIDDLIISVIPVLLGDGVRLFKDGRPEQRLQLVKSKSYETGLVQLHYTNPV